MPETIMLMESVPPRVRIFLEYNSTLETQRPPSPVRCGAVRCGRALPNQRPHQARSRSPNFLHVLSPSGDIMFVLVVLV